MSELIRKTDNRATIRWKLLTGASALVLATYVSFAGEAKAEDATHPLIWLELDGQFAMQKNDLEPFSPAFLSSPRYNPADPSSPLPPLGAESHLGLEKPGPNIWNKGASITYQPEGSDWLLSASIRYGKIGRRETRHQITANPYNYYGAAYLYKAFQDFDTRSSESHTIVDFEAGKDLGLGRFGGSTASLGVRFAQFRSSNQVKIASQPTNVDFTYYRFYASFAAERRFEGLGPMLSWDGSAMIAGNPGDGGLSLDWGVNGALLFGRQKMSEHHQTTKQRFFYHIYPSPTQYTHASVSRSKRVTIPNLGAFAGVSWRYAAAKVTMGYRADYFFNVLDGGIDTAKKEDRAFYGPFLSIAVGIGD